MKLIPMMLVLVVMYAGYMLLGEGTIVGSAGILEEEEETMYVSVTRSDGNVEMELEDYVIQVVGSEMPASFDVEALKAQAIASRTFVMSRNLKVDDTTSTQVFQSEEQFREKWKDQYEEYYTKIQQAVEETKGLVLTYNNKLVRALFFSTSNGHTANSNEYYTSQFPYLVTVESPYDEEVNANFMQKVELNKTDIVSKIGSWDIEVKSWFDSGYVNQVRVGNGYMTGKDVREKLGLRSSCFEILTKMNTVVFITYGSGHGVGMSQYGAQGMALHGYTYDEILLHYYTGAEIVSLSE